MDKPHINEIHQPFAGNAQALVGFPVSVAKLLIMNVGTWGVYGLFWGYKNFRSLDDAGRTDAGAKFSAAICSFFLPICLFGMMDRIERRSAEYEAPIRMPKLWIGITFFLLSTAVGLIGNKANFPAWVDCLLTLIPMIPLIFVQLQINNLYRRLQPGSPINSRLSPLNWAVVFVGVLLLIASMLVSSAPELDNGAGRSKSSISSVLAPSSDLPISLEPPGNMRRAHTDSKSAADYGPYVADVQARIKKAWKPPHENASKRVTASFRIYQNGQIGFLRLKQPSNIKPVDDAALKAVQDCAPFGVLPGPEKDVDIEFTFDYNVWDKNRQIK